MFLDLDLVFSARELNTKLESLLICQSVPALDADSRPTPSARTEQLQRRTAAVCIVCSTISYPYYIFHFSFIFSFFLVKRKLNRLTTTTTTILAECLVLPPPLIAALGKSARSLPQTCLRQKSSGTQAKSPLGMSTRQRWINLKSIPPTKCNYHPYSPHSRTITVTMVGARLSPCSTLRAAGMLLTHPPVSVTITPQTISPLSRPTPSQMERMDHKIESLRVLAFLRT